FILKLDTDGQYIWAKNIGRKATDIGFAIAVDANDNSYITGTVEGTTDFDPGAGQAKISLKGDRDQFILKLNPAGSFVWAKTIGSSIVQGFFIAVDTTGNIYCTGSFN